MSKDKAKAKAKIDKNKQSEIIVKKGVTNNKKIVIEADLKNTCHLMLYAFIEKSTEIKKIRTTLTVCNIDRYKSDDSIEALQNYIKNVIKAFERLQYELDMERMGIEKPE